MFSVIFTKRTRASQIRQFASFFVNSRNRIDRKVIQHSTNVNYSGLINQNRRSFNEFRNVMRKNDVFLPPLMNIPVTKRPSLYSYVTIKTFELVFREAYNKTMQDFATGVRHAITTISEALVLQDYERLNGLVEDVVIDILRKKVDRLTMAQRGLILVNSENLWLFNDNCRIRDGRIADCDYVVELSQMGYYGTNELNLENSRSIAETLKIFANLETNSPELMMLNYTFQRKFKDDVGGPWIATIVNHFSSTS